MAFMTKCWKNISFTFEHVWSTQKQRCYCNFLPHREVARNLSFQKTTLGWVCFTMEAVFFFRESGDNVLNFRLLTEQHDQAKLT